jgi:hypothetical protein
MSTPLLYPGSQDPWLFLVIPLAVGLVFLSESIVSLVSAPLCWMLRLYTARKPPKRSPELERLHIRLELPPDLATKDQVSAFLESMPTNPGRCFLLSKCEGSGYRLDLLRAPSGRRLLAYLIEIQSLVPLMPQCTLEPSGTSSGSHQKTGTGSLAEHAPSCGTHAQEHREYPEGNRESLPAHRLQPQSTLGNQQSVPGFAANLQMSPAQSQFPRLTPETPFQKEY